MLTVVAGDWPADAVIMFKQGFTGPKGLIISKGILSTEQLDGQAIEHLEVVADASSPLVADDNTLRQTTSLFLASKDAKRGASLLYIRAADGRRMLVKANSSEVSQMMALLREAQKTAAKKATQAAASTEEPQTLPDGIREMVGVFLWAGIILMPFIFAWFLLRKGHSTPARVIGFGWMAVLFLLIATSGGSAPPQQTAESVPTDNAKSPTPQQASAPAAPSGPSAEARASFLQTHNTFMGQANRCDTAWQVMTDAIGTNDPYVAYRAADRGSDVCRDASLAMGRLEFGNLIERDTRRALDRAVDECGLAMVGRQTAMDQAARIFDGNTRPSALEEFTQRAGFAQQQTIQCMVQYIGAANDGGYEIPDPSAG